MTGQEPPRRLRIGMLGCGAIAQAGHLDSCTKAHNVELFAICDVADDLLKRTADIYAPKKSYADYDTMLADADIEAVIIATSDAFHVPYAIRALESGKHVLCEKPLGISIEEVEALCDVVESTGLSLQVGHMKRFDPGIQSAKAFIENELGDLVALKSWYCDSTQRYLVTAAVQPPIVSSTKSLKPAGQVKSNLQRYYMLSHGSHLLDTARYLGGELVEVQARYSDRGGMRCWFIEAAFASGALGHFDLTVAVRMDWHEGFQIYGENGSILGKTYNPWLYKSSRVEIYRESEGTYSRTLGADAHFYRRQVEAFAESILAGQAIRGADIDDGLASVRAMVAIGQSVITGKPVRLADAEGEVR